MSEVLQANLFFLITGIAVIVFTFIACIALYHLIRIFTAVRRIMDRVEAGTETITEDIERLRTYVVEESFLSRFFSVRSRDEKTEDAKGRKTPTKGGRSKTELRIRNEE